VFSISGRAPTFTFGDSALALRSGHGRATKLGANGYPYHAEDIGRQEITHDPADAFEFRALTLRQLKDGRNFFHNASFTSVRDVVEYFTPIFPRTPPPERRLR
jgi:cytochrome c peroxidase